MPVSRRSLLYSLGTAAAAGVIGIGTGGGRTEESRSDALVAGSLLGLANAVPGATVEAKGSAAARQLVLDGLRDPDAVALADPRLFAGISDGARLFATNALVLAYNPDAAVADSLTADWRATLEREAFVLGRTDPDTDPLGYRTVMALRLAERKYGLDADAILSRSRIRRETDLLNAVEGGELPVAVAYRSMAVERGLPYRSLPAEIDFSDPNHADDYATVSYQLDGRAIEGAPIRYAAAATTEAGADWVGRLVNDADRLRKCGFGVPESYPSRTAVQQG